MPTEQTANPWRDLPRGTRLYVKLGRGSKFTWNGEWLEIVEPSGFREQVPLADAIPIRNNETGGHDS